MWKCSFVHSFEHGQRQMTDSIGICPVYCNLDAPAISRFRRADFEFVGEFANVEGLTAGRILSRQRNPREGKAPPSGGRGSRRAAKQVHASNQKSGHRLSRPTQRNISNSRSGHQCPTPACLEIGLRIDSTARREPRPPDDETTRFYWALPFLPT